MAGINIARSLNLLNLLTEIFPQNLIKTLPRSLHDKVEKKRTSSLILATKVEKKRISSLILATKVEKNRISSLILATKAAT